MNNNTKSYKVFTVINYIFMFLIMAVMIFPFLNVLAKSFNDGADAARGGIVLLPRVFTLDNYKVLFKDTSMISSFVVTVSRVGIGVVLAIVVQFGAAYALSRKKFPAKNFFVWMFMLPMFFSAGQMPLYVQIVKLGLINNFWVYILPVLFSFYNIVIIRTFIQSTIPFSLEESALIDGANEMIIFSKIILPLCKPILATVALWVMVHHWNDYTTTLLYIRKPSLYTLQYKMMELIKESERIQKMIAAARESGEIIEGSTAPTSDALISAQIMVTTIPIICVYPFLQKYFVKGVMVGSVKG